MNGRTHTLTRLAILTALAAAAAALAGCATGSDQPTRTSLAALATTSPSVTSKPTAPGTPGCEQSLRPKGRFPAPGHMPPGSFMRKIQQRGYLIAGVNLNNYFFGYYDTKTEQEKGFEIDLLYQIAEAIFGKTGNIKNEIHFESPPTVSERVSFVQHQQVDIAADAITITCARHKLVDFSTVYYNGGVRVLVRSNSPVRSLSDLAGKRVCASAGSVPFEYIRDHSRAIAVPRPSATDCLVGLQQGTVDAISTDNAILLGFNAQDPETKIVGLPLAAAPYGMAINTAHPGFVRFVNAVLERMRVDGAWKRIYQANLGRVSTATPAPPRPSYVP
jgi:polar amino acid transport system substrate-binding protein